MQSDLTIPLCLDGFGSETRIEKPVDPQLRCGGRFSILVSDLKESGRWVLGPRASDPSIEEATGNRIQEALLIDGRPAHRMPELERAAEEGIVLFHDGITIEERRRDFAIIGARTLPILESQELLCRSAAEDGIPILVSFEPRSESPFRGARGTESDEHRETTDDAKNLFHVRALNRCEMGSENPVGGIFTLCPGDRRFDRRILLRQMGGG